MEIKCPQCQSKLNIPDEKIPMGKVSSLKCPKCSSKITIDLRREADKSEETQNENQSVLSANGGQKNADDFGVDEEAYDASERPFDFLEEEGKTAMVCENDPDRLAKIKEILQIMEYHITEPEGVREALRKMRYHTYDVVLVNETFDDSDPDANGILVYLERMSMEIRRNIYVVLISNRFKTMDYMSAFLKSVNMTINPKDIDSLDQILTRGINERDLFYDVYKESAKKFGKA
ncbi:MAG: zinc-ribbon domain-containing protein [Desulfobacterales bacterium]|nr:zinc-ribbon domain-containing protein [Desulfobacterales bacterium]